MIRTLLVGAGGYGSVYVNKLLEGADRDVVFAGIVDPFPSEARERAAAAGVPIYDDIDQFFVCNAATFAIVATPIRFHEAHAKACFARGCDVLCEKPVAATSEAARRMMAAHKDACRVFGKPLLFEVGFQWCFAPEMRAFRADVASGRFGKPVSLKSSVFWPRDIAYYKRRGGWAGRKYDVSGEPIFDSVASNATAHYLLNMLYIADANVASMEAETYRVNDIETFDTVTLRARLTNGADLFYAASHATNAGENQDPAFTYTFEGGTARYDGGEITVALPDGEIVSYGASDRGGDGGVKLPLCAGEIRTRDETGKLPSPFCPPEIAVRHTEAMEMMRAVQPESAPFPERMAVRNAERAYVPGLFDALAKAARERLLLSETGFLNGNC